MLLLYRRLPSDRYGSLDLPGMPDARRRVRLEGDYHAAIATDETLSPAALLGSDISAPVGVGLDCATFLANHDATVAHLFRGLDNWVLCATPSPATWRAFCMTYLNLDLSRRFDDQSGWRAADVHQLASLVLGTHPAADIEGTSENVGIPCRVVAGADEASGIDYVTIIDAGSGGGREFSALEIAAAKSFGVDLRTV